MGKVIARRSDGSTFELRTSKKTRFVRTAHERPIHVDLSQLGETPALVDLYLSAETALEQLELAPLAARTFESLTAKLAGPIDLSPLATARFDSLSLDIGGSASPDFGPLHGHPTLKRVALRLEDQPELDLRFVRELPALSSLSIAGGEWRELDLEPLRGLPLKSLSLVEQYVGHVPLDTIAQPALEQLMLQELDIHEGYLDLMPLARCTELQFLSLLGAEVGTLEVSGLAKLGKLRRFDPPNFKQMMMSSHFEPIVAPGLLAWRGQLGVD